MTETESSSGGNEIQKKRDEKAAAEAGKDDGIRNLETARQEKALKQVFQANLPEVKLPEMTAARLKKNVLAEAAKLKNPPADPNAPKDS